MNLGPTYRDPALTPEEIRLREIEARLRAMEAEVKSWKTWTMVAVLALLFVAAGVILIVGIATHDEPTFRDDAITWERSDFPLRTCARDRRAEDIDPHALAALHDVLQTVDARLGFQALIFVEDEPCAILVTFGVPVEPGWQDPGGYAEWSAGERYCDVGIANVHGELMGLVIYHELGHCLGLDHDDYEQSIMYPAQRQTPDGRLPPWISDHDRAAIRERYGHRR